MELPSNSTSIHTAEYSSATSASSCLFDTIPHITSLLNGVNFLLVTLIDVSRIAYVSMIVKHSTVYNCIVQHSNIDSSVQHRTIQNSAVQYSAVCIILEVHDTTERELRLWETPSPHTRRPYIMKCSNDARTVRYLFPAGWSYTVCKRLYRIPYTVYRMQRVKDTKMSTSSLSVFAMSHT